MSLEERLKTMTPIQALAIGLALMGVYYLAAFDSGASTKAATDKARNQINEKRAELEKVNQLISQNQALVQDEKSKEAYLNEIRDIAPAGLTGIDLMRIISNEIKASGASLIRLVDGSSGSPLRPAGFIERVPVQVEIQGTFQQILVFMSNLTRSDRLLVLGDYRMESITDANRFKNLKFVADIIGYRVRSEDPGGLNAK